MRVLAASALLVLVSACGPSVDSASTEIDASAEEDEADAAIFAPEPDAAPRADARPRGDAAGATSDAAPGSPDAAPKPDAAPPMPDAAPPPPPPVGVKDGNFTLSSFDSSNVLDDCTLSAPWGDDSWGIQGITYSDSTTSDLAGARFVVSNGQAYLYGKESDARWGLVRFIQGDIWGSARCGGAVPWNVFTPVAVGGKNVRVGVKVYRDTDNLLDGTSAWVSMAVNLWFSSPDMPADGGDLNGKKPLVVDLLFYTECNPSSVCSSLTSVEESSVYHYKKKLPAVTSKVWSALDLDVSQALTEAIDTFDLGDAASTMKLYQAEVIVTVRNAEGATSLDDFSLSVQ